MPQGEQKFRSLLEAAPDAMVIVDADAFTILPDGRRILVSLLDQEGSDIKLLENFR
jgi:hypothetical protein